MCCWNGWNQCLKNWTCQRSRTTEKITNDDRKETSSHEVNKFQTCCTNGRMTQYFLLFVHLISVFFIICSFNIQREHQLIQVNFMNVVGTLKFPIQNFWIPKTSNRC